MAYGLDMSAVRYEVDENGNRLRAIVPLTMFSTLTAFWIEARRAQTAQIEARARPGMYRGSLASVPSEAEAVEEAAASAAPPPARARPPEGKFGREWARLIEQMPDTSEPVSEAIALSVEAPQAVSSAADSSEATEGMQTRGKLAPRVFFAREFEEAPPAAVLAAIRRGVYFLRAWREYLGLTIGDVAELFGSARATIAWYEGGFARPKAKTLERFARVFDCPVAQLTPKADSNVQPWLTVIDGGGAVHSPAPEPGPVKVERRAPDDTEYPNAVLAHMMAGKTPLTSWRLHRRLSLRQIAEQYGCSADNIRQLEESETLRPGTIAKLCPILHCKPAQLLRPASMATPERRRQTDNTGACTA